MSEEGAALAWAIFWGVCVAAVLTPFLPGLSIVVGIGVGIWGYNSEIESIERRRRRHGPPAGPSDT